MAHFTSITGRLFVLLLLEDGWEVDKERTGFVTLKKGQKRVGITVNFTHPPKRVRAICEAHDITAERFAVLLRTAMTKHNGATGESKVH